MDNTTQNTQAVIQKHLAAFSTQDGNIVAENFSDDAFLSTHLGTVKGKKELTRFWNFTFKNLPEGYMDTVQSVYSHIENETGYLVYTAKPFVEIGTDTWHIKGDKIQSQTYTSYPILDLVKTFFEK